MLTEVDSPEHDPDIDGPTDDDIDAPIEAPVEPPPYSRLRDLGARLPPLSALGGPLVVVVCTAFVLRQLRPELLITDSTPAGGDMGAHVWGPAYMRDHLLPAGRLTGWTPDWYAGFPAYHFYMVVPALAIIALNAGVNTWLGLLACVPLVVGVRWARQRFPERAGTVLALGLVAAVLIVGMPYGVAFKLVSVAGLVAMPACAYAMARWVGSPQPVPAFVAIAATIFLFDTNFNIYGGNIASTLAGEFAFALSLALSLLAIGLVARGLDRDLVGLPSQRVLAAVVIALVALCHVIPLIFTVVALAVVVLLDRELPRGWALAIAITLSLLPVGMAEGTRLPVTLAAAASFGIVAASIMAADRRVWQRARWLLAVGPAAALLAMFWLLPFYVREPYFNDMGWERLDEIGPSLLTTPMLIALPVAAVGAIVSFLVRDRLGILFTILAGTSVTAVANLPEAKLWNARLLPFYYLSVFIVAAVGVALVARMSASVVSGRVEAPDRVTVGGATVAAVVAMLFALALPLRILPFGSTNPEGDYTWLGITSSANSFVGTWAAWNYSGYEDKRSYAEYRAVVETMDEVGATNGCGRAMWEYDKEFDRYGTPMALMLLPHWTDGCIGSMEGLYFESSATTPFHFLNQSRLSENPSRAQRDLPYGSFDLERGIDQLQVMGVRYYLASTDRAIGDARDDERLTELAESPPFVVFEVAGSELAEGLDVEPVVTSGAPSAEAGEDPSRFELGWLSQAVAYYGNPTGFRAMPAEDGPESWTRVTTLLAGDGQEVRAAEVTDIVAGSDSLSFTVDEPGTPVLVKMSYFPNWSASGADGPWRVGPNLMVVLPTEHEVELRYRSTWVEYAGWVLTLGGIAALVALARTDRKSGRPS